MYIVFLITSIFDGICRDPFPWWHVASISIRISSIRISPRGHVARFSYPDSLREKHTTLANITFGRPTYPIRMCLSGSLAKVSKSYYIIPTACHSPRSVPSDGVSGRSVRTSFAGKTEPELNLGWKHASTWQLRGSGTQGINTREREPRGIF